jgi:hypothetical protein
MIMRGRALAARRKLLDRDSDTIVITHYGAAQVTVAQGEARQLGYSRPGDDIGFSGPAFPVDIRQAPAILIRLHFGES